MNLAPAGRAGAGNEKREKRFNFKTTKEKTSGHGSSSRGCRIRLDGNPLELTKIFAFFSTVKEGIIFYKTLF